MHSSFLAAVGTGGLALAIQSSAPAAQPETYLPAGPEVVLEHLPDGAFPLRSYTGNERPSIEQVRSDALAYIEVARRSGDLRYLGYADGALRAWESVRPPPAPLLLPRAMLQQARHEFDQALATLDLLHERQPDNAQAWLTRAVVHQVRGEPDAALRSCIKLHPGGGRLITAACIAGSARITGDAATAYRLLRAAIRDATDHDREHIPWALRVLAELAEINGDPTFARACLIQALDANPGDIRTRLALADLLLRQHDAATVLEIVPADSRSPVLTLRRALAASLLGHPDLARHQTVLEDYFAAARRRGETLHDRESALADLRIFGRPERALAVARRNWRTQREFADTELLLGAALACGDLATVQQVRDWLRGHHNLDARLAAILRASAPEGSGDAS